MSAFKPRTMLETHEVTNQPPPFEDVNLFTSDLALQHALGHAGGAMHAARLAEFGARAGSAEVAEWAMQANRNPPQLKSFDRYGQRIDEVEFHPAYHELMHLGLDAGIAASAWSGLEAGHVLHSGHRIPDGAGRAGRVLPDDHDLCRAAGAAPSTRCREALGAAHSAPANTIRPRGPRPKKPASPSAWR